MNPYCPTEIAAEAEFQLEAAKNRLDRAPQNEEVPFRGAEEEYSQ